MGCVCVCVCASKRCVDFREFMAALSILVKGTVEEKHESTLSGCGRGEAGVAAHPFPIGASSGVPDV